MPNQAQDYAKSGQKISQIRLTCRTNVPNRAHKYTKSGSNRATTTRPTGKKIQFSLALSLEQRHRTHLQRGEAN